jgi:hypothetical protein
MNPDVPAPRSGFRLFGPRRAAPPAGEGLRVHAEFDGGNVAGVSVVSPSHIRFSARADTSPRPLWFYFCLEGATTPAVRCELRNADQCLGPRFGWRTARPVFSPDGAHWERVARAEYVEEATDFGHFAFTVPVVGRRTYVAYSYPYCHADLEAVLQPLSAQRFELCRSQEDRPIAHLRLGNHSAPRRSVWVIARQHAGETPASYVAEGLIRALTAQPAPASAAQTAYHLVPMLDVDGVARGRYGKDQEPVDFNRDWRDHPVRPEVTALVRALRASHETAPIALVLDLHASHHGDTACYAFGVPPAEDGTLAACQQALVARVAAEGPATVGFRPEDLRTEPQPERSCRDYLTRALRVPALTFEISYHLSQAGRYLNVVDYRDFGAALARAVDQHLAPQDGNNPSSFDTV